MSNPNCYCGAESGDCPVHKKPMTTESEARENMGTVAKEIRDKMARLMAENEELKDYGTFAYANGYEQGLFDTKIGKDLLQGKLKIAKEALKWVSRTYYDDDYGHNAYSCCGRDTRTGASSNCLVHKALKQLEAL